jgi:hypothetical protein
MVSPGTPGKLSKFLELNPTVPRDSIFVDDSENYSAYKGMRFGKLDGSPLPEGTKMAPAPELGWDWLGYLGNVMSLSPVREGEDGIPEGVTLLGGTVVLSGEKVVYASADRLPGDYPSPSVVMEQVKASAA